MNSVGHMETGASSKSVLLMESEKGVIRDLTCSLRLIDVSVCEAGSIAEAKNSARTRKPGLVIARSAIGADFRAGVTLARELADDQELNGIPIILMCTPSEKSMVQDQLSLFDAELALPIEFPSVTYQIQGIFSKFAGGKVCKPQPAAIAPQIDLVERIAKSIESMEGCLPTAVLPPLTPGQEQNLNIAYQIQVAVMEELRRSKFFGAIKAEKVPQVVAAVTRSVGQYFDLKRPV